MSMTAHQLPHQFRTLDTWCWRESKMQRIYQVRCYLGYKQADSTICFLGIVNMWQRFTVPP